MSIEVIKQALEALEMYLKLDTMDEAHILEVEIAPKAITALRAAIEQAEKPVAWQGVHDHTDLYYRKPPQADVRPLYTTPPVAPVQEPVAWTSLTEIDWARREPGRAGSFWAIPNDPTKEIALYTAPQRQWVGLTDEERHSIQEWKKIQEELGPVWAPMMLYLYLAIEAKLKEKNDG